MAAAYPNISVVNDRKAAKPFIRYDHYLDDSSGQIFKDESKPLGEYLKMRAMVAIPPCNTVRHGRLLLPGDELQKNKPVGTEFGKIFTRSLLKGLWEIDQQGEFLSDITEDNIFVSRSGRAKLKSVVLLKKEHVVQPQKNYQSIFNILTKIYSSDGRNSVPEDISHLLELIRNYPAKADLYHIHASLVPLSKRQASYLKMYEHLIFVMDENSRQKILLNLPYVDEWRKKIENNRLLQRTYGFRPQMYQVPTSPEQQNQPTFEEQLARNKKRKREESKNMLAYLRHRTAHRMDDWAKDNAEGKPYDAEDSELVSFTHLPLSHPRLQEELYDAKELKKLKFDELF